MIGAVATVLLADAELVRLLGGPKVFERVPGRAREPYVVVGPATSRAWTTATEDGAEVDVTVRLLMRRAALSEAEPIVERIEAALSFETLRAAEPDLRNWHVTAGETRRRPANDELEVRRRFRAVVEQEMEN